MWYEDRPPASDRKAAFAKVFELARIPLGMMLPEDAEDWKEWLDAVEQERAYRGSREGELRHCSACGAEGHNRRSCPVAKPELEDHVRGQTDTSTLLLCSKCLVRPAIRDPSDGVVPPMCGKCR